MCVEISISINLYQYQVFSFVITNISKFNISISTDPFSFSLYFRFCDCLLLHWHSQVALSFCAHSWSGLAWCQTPTFLNCYPKLQNLKFNFLLDSFICTFQRFCQPNMYQTRFVTSPFLCPKSLSYVFSFNWSYYHPLSHPNQQSRFFLNAFICLTLHF